MGGKPSSTDKDVDTLFSTFNTQIKKDVDMMLTILNDIVDTDTFSLDNELLLGQMFTSISQHVTNVQSQLVFYNENLTEKKESSLILSAYTFGEIKIIKFISFFMNIEWTLSDIKTSKQSNWKRNVEDVIKKIRAFMQTGGNFTAILNQVQKKKEPDAQLSFTPKFKQPEPNKGGEDHRIEGWKEKRVKELELKLQVVDHQIQDLS